MLHLYTNFTPDAQGLHYIGTEAAFNSMLNDYLLSSYNIDNYRITDGTVKLAFGSSLTINNYKDVTYMCDTADGKYYYVDDATIISGYVIYSLSVDLWATWMPRATLSNTRIIRCNRNIDNGIYDDIVVSGNRSSARLHYTDNYIIDATERSNKLVVVLYLEVLYADITGIFKQSAIESYVIDMRALWLRYNSNSDGLAFGAWLSRWVGSVSGRAIGAGQHHKDARLLSAYILPGDMVYANLAPTYTIEFSLNVTTVVGISAHPLSMGMHTWSEAISINPQYKYYVGSLCNYTELKRRTQPYNIQCRCNAGADRIAITLCDGDNEYDITSQFMLPVETTDNTSAGVKLIQQSLSTVGIVGGAIVGGPAGVGMSIGSLINQGVGILAARHGGYGHVVGGGDAMTTYIITQDGANTITITPPLYLHTYDSMSDEGKIARSTGADFGEMMPLTLIFDYALLGTGSDTTTYVQATVDVDGIPSNARDIIQSKLVHGVRLIKL